MKFTGAFIILGLFFLSGLAYAQTPVPNQVAKAYEQNCLKQKDPRLTEKTQSVLCTCTAHFMQKNFTMEDMQAMQGDGQTARLSLNRMLTNVYAPCMEFPVYDLIYQKCNSDPQIPAAQKEKLCTCLAGHMAVYTAETSKDMLHSILKNNPNITDPMSPILNSRPFKDKERSVALSCAQSSF